MAPSAALFTDQKYEPFAHFRLIDLTGQHVYANLRVDWALLEPLKLPGTLLNRVVVDSRELIVSGLGDFEPAMNLLVVNGPNRYDHATCSGTKSLISLAGSGGMQTAYSITCASSTFAVSIILICSCS